jgi:predicted PurR-regulated permease PerM
MGMIDGPSVKRFFEKNWEKMALWAILIGLFYLLKPFFLLIFETFLITFITKNIVCRVVERWRFNHRLATVAVFLLFMAVAGLLGAWIGPKLVLESNRIMADFAGKTSLQARDDVNRIVKSALVKIAGEEQAGRFLGSEQYQLMKQAVKSETAKAMETFLPRALDIAVRVLKVSWQILISLLLALIFSFILVLDWKEIAGRMKTLESSRIRSFYLGAAPHLQAFASVLGKAFSAQAIISAVNTILTAAGLFFFHVPNVAILSMLVFACGFIPILGTLISSVPILVIALQVGGFLLALKILVLLVVLHSFGIYILNPKITAGFFHVHPILILVLLLVGERFFGIWGMVIGVPVGYYVLSVLTRPEDAPADALPEKPLS